MIVYLWIEVTAWMYRQYFQLVKLLKVVLCNVHVAHRFQLVTDQLHKDTNDLDTCMIKTEY